MDTEQNDSTDVDWNDPSHWDAIWSLSEDDSYVDITYITGDCVRAFVRLVEPSVWEVSIENVNGYTIDDDTISAPSRDMMVERRLSEEV